MSKEVFIGTATALVTPFKDDGIDFETFGQTKKEKFQRRSFYGCT
jgi:dihydrodipicolinate synthase/N-acetylneuraminate lyase